MKTQQVNKLILSFIHSNYLEQASGTEKFVRTLSKLLRSHGYSHLAFFSIKTEIVYKAVGVIFNDQFKGIYRYDDIHGIIDWYCCANKLEVAEIMLQHLRNHDLGILGDCISRMNVPVALFIHDLYTLCPSETMVNSEGYYCQQPAPSSACLGCRLREDAINHYDKINIFLKEIGSHLFSVVCPSEFLRNKWCAAFPDYRDIAIVRPHNILSGHRAYQASGYPINVAFCGAQLRNKGFEKWTELVGALREDTRFHFYYLGKGSAEFEGVTNVYVNNALQGEEAMRDAIQKNRIQCAFVWPLCPETYSYVYDELTLNGVFILTNSISGNIAAQISTRHNGVIFEDFEELLHYLKGDKLVSQMDAYRLHGTFHPVVSKTNEDIAAIVIQRALYSPQGQKRAHFDPVMTLAYKARRILKRKLPNMK